MTDLVESGMLEKKAREGQADLAEGMFANLKEAEDFWSEIIDDAIDDLKFSRGEDADQWDYQDFYNRQLKRRPNYTQNRTQPFIDEIVGDQQKVSMDINIAATTFSAPPFNSENDNEYNQAQTYQSLISGIDIDSNATRARDYAFEMSVNASIGYYTAMPVYADEHSFHQTININMVSNPMSVRIDPRALLLGPEKALYGYILNPVPKRLFKEQNPGATIYEPSDVKGTSLEGWYMQNSVMVARYFEVRRRKATVILLSDGRTYEADILEKHAESILSGNATMVDKRETMIPQCYTSRVTGGKMGKWEVFPSKYVPIIPVFGRLKVIEGKPHLRSAIRNSKDPQKVYNLMTSALAEVVGKAPKTQWLMDWNAVPEAFRTQYTRADFDNLMTLFYDGEKGDAPSREQPIQAHAGLMQATQQAWEDLKGTMGKFQDSFDGDGVDASGVALKERRGSGESVSYPFLKNLSHAMIYEGKLLIDMIPRVFNYEQVLRLPFDDGSEDFLHVNKMQWNPEKGGYEFANELTPQRFQVSVDIGPAQRSMREQAQDTLMKALEIVGSIEPRLGPPLLRLIAENSDFPGAQNLSDMIAKIIDPAFSEGDDKEQELTPAAVQQMVSQAVNEALEQAGVQLEQFRAETDRMEAAADRVKAKAAIIDAEADMIEARNLN